MAFDRCRIAEVGKEQVRVINGLLVRRPRPRLSLFQWSLGAGRAEKCEVRQQFTSVLLMDPAPVGGNRCQPMAGQLQAGYWGTGQYPALWSLSAFSPTTTFTRGINQFVCVWCSPSNTGEGTMNLWGRLIATAKVLRLKSRGSCSALTWSAGVWSIEFSEESGSDAAAETRDDLPATIREDEIAWDYLDLFDGVGVMKESSYEIRLLDGAQPYSLATARRVPYHMLEKVQAELQRMVQLGVIQPISEPTEWCSPMVVVPKKNGEVRICVDYTKLNRSIQRERFQLPLADKISAKLKGAQFFTTLDAAAGFWQIPLAEESSALTAFITPFGRCRFTRLPFGLSSGPEVFHKAMLQVLEGLDGTDCLSTTCWFGEVPKKSTIDVFVKYSIDSEATGYNLQPSKCHFRLGEVTYYGHVLLGKGESQQWSARSQRKKSGGFWSGCLCGAVLQSFLFPWVEMVLTVFAWHKCGTVCKRTRSMALLLDGVVLPQVGTLELSFDNELRRRKTEALEHQKI